MTRRPKPPWTADDLILLAICLGCVAFAGFFAVKLLRGGGW